MSLPDPEVNPQKGRSGLTRVAQAYQGKPVLTAGQIEDVVAFLQTLQ